jgi:hypothetical protein
MDRVNLDGMMVEGILVLIKMIRKMVMENFIGQTENTIKVIGEMVVNMVSVYIRVKRCHMKDSAISRKGKEPNGLNDYIIDFTL